ncbi:MAG: formate C-acetyltransferase [Candidatus Ancillula sp.]|jgi:formate C-acetyltransferase|nr:formate C-acetyltransferase [Candidatus Ancillula sp.]
MSTEEFQAEAWAGFKDGKWQKEIDVRDFIQKNYTPYDGDSEFLAGPTEKTKDIWNTLDSKYLAVEREKRVYDVDTKTVLDIDTFPAGYINDNDDVIVGIQTDVPTKRGMMPRGGWRMVETAIKEAGKEPDPFIKEIYTKHRKTHNDGVFDVYTPRVRACRHSHILTGLPDAYGRGRIIGDYRRVALYGINYLIEQKKIDKDSVLGEEFSEDWVRFREEHSEQIKALKQLINLGNFYGFDLSRPAQNAKEAVQWTYFGYLASVKSQDGAAMSFGRLSAFFDVYFERDLKNGALTEEEAQEIIDNIVIKLRIVRFLRTEDYDQIFSGDPYWATWSDAGFGDDGRHMVTKTSYRLLQTLRNLGPAPEPNITIFWDKKLPQAYKDFCAAISIETSSIQYESDKQIREKWGDDAAIACCVSPMRVGKQMQFFGARMNAAKAFLYGINGGKDEVDGTQIFDPNVVSPIMGSFPETLAAAGGVLEPGKYEDKEPLDYNEVRDHFEKAVAYLAEVYVEALNIIHYMHDKYAYEAVEMALLDKNIVRTLGCGIAGLSIVADSLSAVKYAKVYPIRNENGLVIDYRTEGEFPIFGNDDDRADELAKKTVHFIMDTIRSFKIYRNAIPTQSILTITSNVVYGKKTGAFPSGHEAGTPFAPGANPENGMDTHGMLASMLSVAKIPYEDALDGISLTNTITPNSLGSDEQEQIKNLTGILDSGFGAYSGEGLYHANINVLNRETLEDAMKNPEKYPHLTIRVSGYAVNFVKLTKEQQLDVLSRTFHSSI